MKVHQSSLEEKLRELKDSIAQKNLHARELEEKREEILKNISIEKEKRVCLQERYEEYWESCEVQIVELQAFVPVHKIHSGI